jgi:hypothetical protein
MKRTLVFLMCAVSLVLAACAPAAVPVVAPALAPAAPAAGPALQAGWTILSGPGVTVATWVAVFMISGGGSNPDPDDCEIASRLFGALKMNDASTKLGGNVIGVGNIHSSALGIPLGPNSWGGQSMITITDLFYYLHKCKDTSRMTIEKWQDELGQWGEKVTLLDK